MLITFSSTIEFIAIEKEQYTAKQNPLVSKKKQKYKSIDIFYYLDS